MPSLFSDLAALASKHPVGSFTASSLLSFFVGKKVIFFTTLRRWARSAIDEYYDTKAYRAERKAECEKRIAIARAIVVRER